MLRTELRDLPAGNIAMHTVKKCRIRTHFGRERVEQAGRFEKNVHALIDIADKDHGRCRGFFLLAACKRARRHVVLHDLNTVFVLEVDAGNLIESYTVPQTDQTDSFASHIVKQVRYCGLAAGNQNTVRRDFLIDMRFARTARAQLTQIEVVLDKRYHTRKEQPLFAFGQCIRLVAARTQHDVQPFGLCKLLTACFQLVNIHVRHLNRRQLADMNRRSILILFHKLVFQSDDTPDATAKQAIIFCWVILRNRHIFNAKI